MSYLNNYYYVNITEFQSLVWCITKFNKYPFLRLPRKTDMERKTDIFNFSSRTRLLATRLLALVKWASSAAKVDKSVVSPLPCVSIYNL